MKCLIFTFLLGFSSAYKILVVFPMPAKSHNILGEGFVNTLAEAGHEVTTITPYPVAKPRKNIRQVDFSSVIKLTEEHKTVILNIDKMSQSTMSVHQVFLMGVRLSNSVLKHENVQKMLNDQNEKFDVVIAEWFYSNTYTGFSAVYNCPFIWVSSVDPHPQVLKLIDERSNPAYTSRLLSKSVPPFSFLERLSELWMQIYTEIIDFGSYIALEKSYYKDAFEAVLAKRGRTLPPLHDVMYNASLMFFNAQPSLGIPFKLSQNAKYIGGYHIDPKTKPLPEYLQKLFDDSKEGVIYFSMGSNLQSKNLKPEIKESLIKMFGRLKQTVLWKFEDDLKDLPKNLHIIKWAPQPSVLNHKNTRMFITHGGKLSTTEAIYYGVPVIGIPIFNDQFINMKMAVEKGYGIIVSYGDDLADRLEVAIQELINDPSYSKRTKELSSIFHDLPVTPRQELVHWVEHVVKTKGAPHLRSPAVMVPWYQKMYLDLAALIFLIYFALKKCCKKCCKKQQVDSKKKNK